MARYLIVNADDFGLTEGVSKGIIRAYKEGILTSTTFMVNFPWAAEMAPMLKGVPELGVGIHLNLTTGPPVLPAEQVPSLVTRDGSFSKALYHLVTRVDPAEALREWSAQVEKGIRLMGTTPTHLDTHRYLQGIPRFAEVMLEVARRYDIPAARCLYPGPDLNVGELYRSWNPTRLLINRYLHRSAALISASGVSHPQATLAGDFDRYGLLRKLERVREGVTELIAHPGLVDDRLRELSSMHAQRNVELEALTDPEVCQQVAVLGIDLVSFAHLQR